MSWTGMRPFFPFFFFWGHCFVLVALLVLLGLSGFGVAGRLFFRPSTVDHYPFGGAVWGVFWPVRPGSLGGQMDCHAFCTTVPTRSVIAPTRLVTDRVVVAGVLVSPFWALVVMTLEFCVAVL